jgi:hypothetical protein
MVDILDDILDIGSSKSHFGAKNSGLFFPSSNFMIPAVANVINLPFYNTK